MESISDKNIKKVKFILLLLISNLLLIFFVNYKNSYYGYTKSMFNKIPPYVRAHYRGSDLGNTGFCFVRNDINLNIIDTFYDLQLNNQKSIRFKEIYGYYYNKKSIIVNGIDTNNNAILILINKQNFLKNSYDLLKFIPENKTYEFIEIPKDKFQYYILRYLIIFFFILLISLIYLIYKLMKTN